MENKTVFKVGQYVYCGLFEKWGKVVSVTASEVLPIKVVFINDDNPIHYTNDGRYLIDTMPTLSFTEYKIQGVDQTPPRKPYEVGDVVFDCDRKTEGKVVGVEKGNSYPIVVEFNTSTATYTEKGFKHEKDRFPKLSYTPYDYKNGGFT